MADITPSKSLSIEEQLKNLELVKYHPAGILQVSLNRVTDMYNGQVTVTDPSNPFIYLLESSAMNTAFAIQQFTLLTRKLYPRLANTQEDLYLHMSDYDFLGRFSTPSYAHVVFNILFNDFKTKATYNAAQKEHVLKLPRHLKITIGQYRYLLTSAIIIRQTENDVVDVKFEDQDFNNMFPVTTNYINFSLRRASQDETYLSFGLKLPEVDIDVLDIAADLTSACKGALTYNPDRKYYFARVFHYKDDKWNEMLVTHTNDVYDINTPTCIIKVLTDINQVQYHIPAVYTTTGVVSPKLKFLIYTTMGKISVNFGDFQLSEFGTEYGDVFPETELDQYTQPIETITKLIYTSDVVSSGEDGMTFEELKDAVIDNSIGDRKLPITSKQLAFETDRANFKIIKDVDVVTGRIYKLETEIPSPLTRYPITKFNLDILELATTVSDLRAGNGTISYTSDITVIPEGTLFRLENGVLIHITQQEVEQLKQLSGIELVNSVNQSRYLTTYYHYVLDTSNNTTKLRAYDLTLPSVKQINFQKFNSTARIGMNTINANLYRTAVGYNLDVMANSKSYISGLSYLNVTPYLVYVDNNDSKFYLQGTFLTEVSNSPVYRFSMTSDYYIDSENRISLTGFVDNNGTAARIGVDLNAELQMLYTSNTTPPAFEMTDMDTYITNSYMSGLQCAVSLENISLRFGDYLERLFAGVHTSTGAMNYQLYQEDVVLRYTTTVYNSDNQIVHQVGDIVYDENDEPMIQYHRGTVKLDAAGDPVGVDQLELMRYLNLLLIDYRVKLATAKTVSDYNTQIKTHLTEVCLEDAVYAQSQLLDNTEAYVVVPKTVGDLRVKTPTGTRTISSMQSFVVDVYVNYDTYNSSVIRDDITYDVTRMLDEYLYQRTVVKKTEALNTIFTKLKEFVVSVSLTRFTELDEEYFELIDKNSRISLAKTLTLEATGYSLKEDIVVNFRLID